MRSTIIFLLLLIINVDSNAQNYKTAFDEIYIFINNKNFRHDVLGYKAYFDTKSDDKRFQSDNYSFRIDYKTLDYISLYNLGKLVNKDSISYIDPLDYYKGKTNYEIHIELSLYKRIYIVTNLPEKMLIENPELHNKLIIWSTSYAGTVKDVSYMSYSGKNLLED
ncbi:hypothetical protein [Hanstruepera marina]|uniref:hypothetical protein n=1 Tax=Hanstruepera marina TaxID=2873265 RepID=UPI001CA735DA|nr:hypothetical protein [Hanstruepera marina]